MNIIENYNKCLQDIYNHVGFEEDYVVYPIDDDTQYYWQTENDYVRYAKTEEELENIEAGNYYKDEIYKQRFYDRWVYIGVDYTMIFCDPHVDGMRYFRLFDNKKRIK